MQRDPAVSWKRMRSPIILSFLAVASLAAPAEARNSKVTMTGADFLSACSRADPDWIGFCHGYVQAIVDEERRPSEAICPPAGTTRAKIVGNVVAHLKASPKLQELNAAAVVHAVLRKSFPCQ